MRPARSTTRRFAGALLAAALVLPASACDDFLDVNDNPNGPETVSANLYLTPMQHWMAHSPLWDGRFVGRYTQQWKLPGASLSTWDRMGYDPSSDNGGQVWRDVYWSIGQNLVDMMEIAEREERWDLLGVGNVVKAWGWLATTNLHGELIIRQAFDQTRFSFDYDSQEFAYEEVGRLLDSAIVLLGRTDGAVDASYLGRTDVIYNGDRTKWLKFAWGLKARYLNHFSNKSSYDPAAVIAAVNNSLSSNADDALLPHPATNNNDTNFYGRTRNNLTNYRQT
ncbi:MAG TPA: SusD/RagB family nutrient-binding outer membrane lipoprotein, partial [Gemmatimonadaceae bacterium]|nr:SusD/RagB family nutrient-binding outer membrane lipoprotein [Gemmatimonadaceae bacterium]